MAADRAGIGLDDPKNLFKVLDGNPPDPLHQLLLRRRLTEGRCRGTRGDIGTRAFNARGKMIRVEPKPLFGYRKSIGLGAPFQNPWLLHRGGPSDSYCSILES